MDDETIQRRRWGILGVLVLCLLVVILDNTILNVALRTIQDDLNASQSEMQWAVDSYALVFAGLLITWGVLGDRLGRKRMLVIGLIVFGAMSALCSFAQSSTELILFRALMGIGAAAVQPQTLSIIQNVFEPRERPKAIGIWAGASGMAIALGPITGGLLLKYFWWGSIFLVNVPIVIIAVVAIFFLVPESKDPKPGRLDPVGVLLSIAALVILVYGVIQGGDSNDWLRWDTLGAIVVGVALLALFVWTQARSTHPTIDVRLFRNRAFSSGSAAIAAAFFALQGSTFFLAYYLQAVRDYTPLLAGVALIGVALAVMTAAPLSAKLSGRFGPRAVVGFGMTLVAISLGSYAFVTQHTSVLWLELRLVGFGFGMGLTMSPATNAIMGAVPREKAGAGSAVNNTVRQVAGALGVAILGSLLVVIFRNDLGTGTPREVAARIDRPVAQSSTAPKVGALVETDTTQSIQNALIFAEKAKATVEARGDAQQALPVLGGFVADTKSSFMSAMRLTSVFGGLAALLGALVAMVFLPGKREFAESHGPAPAAAGKPAETSAAEAPPAASPAPPAATEASPAATAPDPSGSDARHLDPVPAASNGHVARHAAHEPEHSAELSR